MWGMLGAALANAGVGVDTVFGPGYPTSSVRMDPFRHVCRHCEIAWRDTNNGDSACEFCGQPCPVLNDVLTKACSAPAPYWKLPAEDDE
jgi:hypothetical protein